MTSRVTDRALQALIGEIPAQGDTVTLSLSTSAATTATALTAGKKYDMVCDVDCFVCSSTVGADDATTSDYFLPALTIVPFTPGQTNTYISGIVSAGTGTLFISPRTPVNVMAE